MLGGGLRLRLPLEWLLALACTLAVAWFAPSTPAVAALDHYLLDLVSTRLAGQVSDEILLVAIDEQALAEQGKWPWDRRTMAGLVDRLDQAGARQIVLDILYTEPSDPVADQALATAMTRSGKVLLPYALVPARGRADGVDILPAIPALAQAAAGTGHVGLDPDSDGLIRRIPLVLEPEGRRLEHLMIVAQRLTAEVRQSRAPDTYARPILPLHKAGAYRTVSAAAVLGGEVPPAFIAGKVVIVGGFAQGLGDTFPVSGPAGYRMSGAEIQANLYQARAQGLLIVELSALQSFGPAAIAVFAMFLGFWRLAPGRCLALAIALVVLLGTGAILLALAQQVWFAPGSGILAIALAHPIWGWRRLSAVGRFLQLEAARLETGLPDHPEPRTFAGFDTIAREVGRLRFLVDELNERGLFLSRTIEAIPDPLCVLAGNGRLATMNAAARSLLGRASAGEELSAILAAAGAQLSGDGTELRFADGRIFEVASSLARDQDAELSIYAFSDVTERRRSEIERQQMLEFLSHDMRSPQVSILSLATPGSDLGSLSGRLSRIRDHARRTLLLADSFVQVSRLAAAPLDLAEADCCALVEESLDRAWLAARDGGVSLKRELPPHEVLCRCDVQVVSRILDNLIDNAIRYGGQGCTVTVEVAAAEIDGRAAVVLSVTDNGPGLPEERLTDPFQRFGQRARVSPPGAGLGLAFVEAAVARHSGRLAWESSPGLGTCFRFLLPCDPSSPAPLADRNA